MPENMTVEPSEEAIELAETMVERDDIMREIIGETIDSALDGNIKEAGRTKCPTGSSVKGPLERFPRAIDLASCPWDRGGAWHTHVTPDEIRNPVNSLPDVSNVVFGLLDVSVVAGSETADVILSARDEEAAVEAFKNAIGADVNSPIEVTEAAMDGRINPPLARQRVRKALDPLVFTVETGYDEFESEIQQVPHENWAHPTGSGRAEMFTGNTATMHPIARADSFEEVSMRTEELVEGSQLTSLVISTAIGTVVGGVVNRLVFGD